MQSCHCKVQMKEYVQHVWSLISRRASLLIFVNWSRQSESLWLFCCSLKQPYESYEILWPWITRPKTWINEQRPRLACATRSQAPCLLCGVFFQNFGTNELEIVSRSSTLLWMDHNGSMTKFQWSHVLIVSYCDNLWYNMIRLRIMCVSAVFPHVLSVK